ncbi:MAG: hypothetical protein VKJ09_15740, partial [Leptolyngbya sp.]|nr:hypothetical protein [Leptolyngbya sp.]
MPWTLCLLLVGGALWWHFDGEARYLPPPPPPEPVIVVKELPPPPPAWQQWLADWNQGAQRQALVWPGQPQPELHLSSAAGLRGEASWQRSPSLEEAFRWRLLPSAALWVPLEHLAAAQALLAPAEPETAALPAPAEEPLP